MTCERGIGAGVADKARESSHRMLTWDDVLDLAIKAVLAEPAHAMKRGDWPARIAGAQRKAKTHPCCVDTCDRETLLGLLACREHWLALPRPTRYVFDQAFRRRETDPDVYQAAVTLAVQMLNERAAA